MVGVTYDLDRQWAVAYDLDGAVSGLRANTVKEIR